MWPPEPPRPSGFARRAAGSPPATAGASARATPACGVSRGAQVPPRATPCGVTFARYGGDAGLRLGHAARSCKGRTRLRALGPRRRPASARGPSGPPCPVRPPGQKRPLSSGERHLSETKARPFGHRILCPCPARPSAASGSQAPNGASLTKFRSLCQGDPPFGACTCSGTGKGFSIARKGAASNQPFRAKRRSAWKLRSERLGRGVRSITSWCGPVGSFCRFFATGSYGLKVARL